MKKRRWMPGGISLIILFLTDFAALANDGAAGLDGGNLFFKQLKGVELQSELLTISPQKVQVTYKFYNKTEQDIETLVAFPIDIELGTDTTFDATSKNPNNFSVHVNGEKKNFKTKIIKADAKKTIQHYWQQKFPAKKILEIQHSYVPYYETHMGQSIVASKGTSKSEETIRDQYYSAIAKNYCLSPSQVRAARSKRQVFDSLTYILMTANTWDGPIRNFKLRLEKGDRDFLYLCTDLNLKKVGATTFEAIATNFSPKKNLEVAFSRK